MSRAQAECLLATGRLARLDVPASILRRGQSHPLLQDLRNKLEMALQRERDIVIMIGKEEPVNMDEGLQLCQALALLIAPHAAQIGAVISTGGETAHAILSAMGWKTLRLAGEIEPGVPLSVATGSRPVPVITKAGAFGSRETLLRCYETLRQRRAGSAGDTDPEPTDTGSTTLHRRAF